MEIVTLLVGLAIIVKSADVLIDSSSKIARKYGVPAFIIGLTVIAFGTSAPEFTVGLVSGINKANELTLGDVVGSSITNIALIAGLSAALFPLTVKDTIIKREIPILIFVQSLLAFLLLTDGKISRLEGGVLVFGFALFMLYIIVSSKRAGADTYGIEGAAVADGDGNSLHADSTESPKERSMAKLWIFSVLSLLGLFVGGRLAVDSSTKVAELFGLSETLIGLTVVAISTSLPELITSIVAVRKKEVDIILGNCIGSNIFNTLWALGISAVINPISTQANMTLDVLLAVLLPLVIFFVSLITKRISRLFGILLVISYVAYIGLKVIIAFT